jgi:hypothetical protein
MAVLAATFVGFDAFNWQLATGNVAIIELPLAVAMVLLLAQRKYVWAGGVFGLMASLKLLPFLAVVAFLVMPEPKRLRLWSVASATGSLLAIHGLNAVLFGRWLPSYAAQLTARIPGSPGYEGGGVYNQNSIDFVTDGFRQLGLDHPLPGFALACLGFGIGWIASLACARKTHARAELPAGAVVALVMLIVWLFLFRQKNYAFETFIPLMIYVGYSAGRATALTAIAASIIVPAAFISRTVTMPSLEPYYQLLGAWAAVLVLLVGGIVQLRRRERPVPASIGGVFR